MRTLNLKQKNKETIGIGAVLLSALFFYLATFYVQRGRALAETPAVYFVFARFIVGYCLLFFYILLRRGGANLWQMHKLSATPWLWVRAISNAMAVFLFLAGVYYGNVTNANFFNMLYPVFVVVLSPWLLKEKNNIFALSGVVLGVAGTFLISQKNGMFQFSSGDIFALLSGVVASVSIIALRGVRKLHIETIYILFFTFYLGSLFSLFLSVLFYFVPLGIDMGEPRLAWIAARVKENFFPLLAASVCGFGGQFLLTFGFRYVSAVQGSLLSNFRILIALLFSWFYWQQEFLWTSFLGALLIFIANILVAKEKSTSLGQWQ